MSQAEGTGEFGRAHQARGVQPRNACLSRSEKRRGQGREHG